MSGSKRCEPECGCKRHDSSAWSGDQRERQRRYRESHREKIRAAHPTHRLWHQYKLTVAQRDEMFAAQEGCCYLCSEPLVEGSIHIDHDRTCCRGYRSCGTCVRGLACSMCNRGIGHFGDDPERMRRVADNLEMANRRLRNPAQSGLETGSNAPVRE